MQAFLFTGLPQTRNTCKEICKNPYSLASHKRNTCKRNHKILFSLTSLLFILRERADVVHDVPTLFLSLHALLAGGHDAPDAFRDLPEDFAVSHRRHAFLVCEVCRFPPQPREVRFVTRS